MVWAFTDEDAVRPHARLWAQSLVGLKSPALVAVPVKEDAYSPKESPTNHCIWSERTSAPFWLLLKVFIGLNFCFIIRKLRTNKAFCHSYCLKASPSVSIGKSLSGLTGLQLECCRSFWEVHLVSLAHRVFSSGQAVFEVLRIYLWTKCTKPNFWAYVCLLSFSSFDASYLKPPHFVTSPQS